MLGHSSEMYTEIWPSFAVIRYAYGKVNERSASGAEAVTSRRPGALKTKAVAAAARLRGRKRSLSPPLIHSSRLLLLPFRSAR